MALAAPSAALARDVPVRTAQELSLAIAAAAPGDRIILAAGTYAFSANVTCGKAGTSTSPIEVRAASPLEAKVTFDATEGFKVTGPHWQFQGLDVQGVCSSDSACEHAFHVTGAAVGFVLRGSRVRDFNAQVKVNADMVGGVMTVPHDGLIEGNEIFDTRARNTGSPTTKLNIDTGDRWIVRGNYLHDFQKGGGDTVSYGAFMKSGGQAGLFERNLVVCSKDTSGGTRIGLSFGGGGTGPQFCAPAFSANVPCDPEHTGGTMRNNVIANCSDVGIYLNRSRDTKILYNTLVSTAGIDFRFASSTGLAIGNVLSGVIRARDGGTFQAAENLVNVSDFATLYEAPLVGDLRKKGDLTRLLGKGTPRPDITDDYCARTRVGPFDLGAQQASLGDCPSVLPPASPASPAPGEPRSDGGPGVVDDGGAGGSPRVDTAAAPAPEAGCGCTSSTPGRVEASALVGVALLLRRVRTRRKTVT